MDTSTKDRSAFNIVSGKIRLENKVYQVEIEVFCSRLYFSYFLSSQPWKLYLRDPTVDTQWWSSSCWYKRRQNQLRHFAAEFKRAEKGKLSFPLLDPSPLALRDDPKNDCSRPETHNGFLSRLNPSKQCQQMSLTSIYNASVNSSCAQPPPRSPGR